MRFLSFYKLNEDKTPFAVRCGSLDDFINGLRAMEKSGSWRIGIHHIDGVSVSTVFLWRHVYEQPEIKLFETLVRKDGMIVQTRRYATWQEAETGHRAIVEDIQHPEN